MNKTVKKVRVVVAMSGGVDSSVTAAMLKKQGYDVVGVFMRFWHEPLATSHLPLATSNTCCSEGAEQAARDVAAKLKIPFYVLNAQKEFKKAVVDYFLAEERHGRTPNPCVVCNKEIKFGVLFKKALAMGADFVATGHYARIARKFKVKSLKLKVLSKNSEVFKLYQAKDKDKDQSYFLYTLTQEKLNKILFPIGDYKKEDVYAMAKKWKLPYRKGESFDLCFVSDCRGNFLKRYLKMKVGEIRDKRENILGQHQGLPLYTIGQRKGVLVPNGPWWVVKKDEKKNTLYVSNNEKDLCGCELIAADINWMSGRMPKLPMKVWAKIRYKSEAAEAQIVPHQNKYDTGQTNRKSQIVVKFKKPQRAITPGQSVVFYDKNGEVLGGGTIKI